MRLKTLLFTSLAALTISCNNAEVYSKFDNLGEDNRWAQSDAKTYSFAIEDDTVLYDIKFHFSHVYDYQFSTVPIDFIIENDKRKEEFKIDLVIKNEKGEQLADCSGDMCDLIHIIKEKTKLEKGKYTITVSHSFGGPYLPNVIGVGIEVEKAQP